MKNMSKVRNLDMNTYFSTIQDYEDTDLHMKGFPNGFQDSLDTEPWPRKFWDHREKLLII